MNANDTVIAQGKYIGATSDELAGKDAADKVAAGVSQKALFRRRGEITLYRDRLVLTEWAESGELVLRPADIRSVDVRFHRALWPFHWWPTQCRQAADPADRRGRRDVFADRPKRVHGDHRRSPVGHPPHRLATVRLKHRPIAEYGPPPGK
ncbi:hypothetical protein [Fodinicola feengrottensis]|uniref:hypothetical protein n=1 Tax=Fodinicola feengrottensis TaxID=435914 RepID=UPI0024432EA5|nr:hypothetical protein [Fodinicola feengrottensis]